MKLLIGTNNPGKITEILSAFKEADIEIVTPKDLGISGDVDECGTTYEENALLKARFFFEESKGTPTVADDSGIVINALQGELGLHTRRWGAGPAASDEEWIEHFLKRMETEEDKTAAFVCSLAYIDSSGNEKTFRWNCTGTITPRLEADYLPGLPLSACFIPDGYSQVFSAMTEQEKNDCSHRGGAARMLREYLEL